MIGRLPRQGRLWPITLLLVAAVLLMAAFLGRHASVLALAAVLGVIVTAAILKWPHLGLPLIVVAALLSPLPIRTGTEVLLNVATLLIPVMLTVVLLDAIVGRRRPFPPSRVNLPLGWFLAAGLLSLLIGVAIWDPAVPRKDNLILVQLAQWALFAFSGGALWLTASLVSDQRHLKLLTLSFLIIAGGVTILRALPPLRGVVTSLTTVAFIRAPLWVLLFSLVFGQLLFNGKLGALHRFFLVAVLLGILAYSFGEQLDQTSNWVGIGVSAGLLIWLRFPRLRWPVVMVIVGLTVGGILFPALYSFAGGDEGWASTGGSRIVLIQRVVEVTMRNPLTGLGPAAYRFYAGMKPLPYLKAYWIAPEVNSHNNYVDIFSFQGIFGLALFAWFAVAFARTALKLRPAFPDGFLGGYLNGMIAAGAGSLVLMLFADWILPHVYNIGFDGFQASVLVWLFLGGVVALEQIAARQQQGGNS